jgi:uncharacterized membrane protein
MKKAKSEKTKQYKVATQKNSQVFRVSIPILFLIILIILLVLTYFLSHLSVNVKHL